MLTLYPLRVTGFLYIIYLLYYIFFSTQYLPLNECIGRKNKGNDHQFKMLLIVKQILFVSTLGDVDRIVWRILTPMSGRNRLNE